ncbi:exported hypothetical protein [uncultured Desulfobacterium sp.]|uniref:Uncharacterized protein n=1 Tax=uncultured Desulfobacterium sp. TaxID=201089 RepID=A0A445MZW9_9BACT|nr:exported hypothetical protein [uncultured Desulfobacterium sp.]
MFFRCIIAIVCLSIPVSVCAATRLFYENFEDGINHMTHVGSTNGSVGNVNPPHSVISENYDGGSGHCSRIRYGYNGTGLYDQWVDVGESKTGEHYVSYWYRIDSTYDIIPSGYCHKNVRFWHSGDDDMNDICMEMHLYGTGVMEFCPTVSGSNQGNIPVAGNYLDIKWHHVEIWIKYDSPASASNGELKCWIDGTLVSQVAGKNLVKEGYPSYTRFSIPSNKSQNTDPDYYYVDEVEVWDGMPVGIVDNCPDDSNKTEPGECGCGTPDTDSDGDGIPDCKDNDVPSQEGLLVFSENWETGNKSLWDSTHTSLTPQTNGINGISLQRVHVAGTTSTGSCDKGFADNDVPGFTSLKGERVNDVILESSVLFSSNFFPTDGSTKVMLLESWPGSTYPSTSEKDFQAIVEVTGISAHANEFVVTIKREGMDFYTRYQTVPVTVVANQIYRLKLRIKLDEPYTASNGVLQFWVNDILKIDKENEDFVLAIRGSDIPKGLNMLMVTGYTGGSGSPDAKIQYWDDIKLYVPVQGQGTLPNAAPAVPAGINITVINTN